MFTQFSRNDRTTDKNPRSQGNLSGKLAGMAYNRLQHRELSILVGVLVGILLDVFATTTDSVTNFTLTDLVIVVTIPALSGALAGFADLDHAIRNGLMVGVVAGRVYVVISALKLPDRKSVV